jgi:serine/threonine protein kinase
MLYLDLEPQPAPPIVRKMVEEVFCDRDSARYGPYELLDDAGTTVLEDTLYEFTVADTNDDKTYYLQLFTGAKGIGGMIWDQEIRTMMRISRLGHPALPDVIKGGYEESSTGLDDFAYVITPKPEARLNDFGEMERLSADRREALWQFGMLADALAKLHSYGIIHRNLWPGTIERYRTHGGIRSYALRLVRFEMSAFIENIFRRFTLSDESTHSYAMHDAVRRFVIGEGIYSLACCAPERLRLLSPTLNLDPEETPETDLSDVYSLGAVITQWFFDRDRFNEDLLAKAFGGGNIDLDAAKTFQTALRNSLGRTRKPLPKGLRRLIENMLAPHWRDRPSSQEVCDEISRNYEPWALDWSERQDTPRLVGYLPEETGTRIYDWRWVSHNPLDKSNPIGVRMVTELIQDDLRDSNLVYSPEGFTPFAEGDTTRPMATAKHVLLGKKAGWFCQPFYPHNQRSSKPWEEVLLIKYVARRDGPRGGKLDDLYKGMFRRKTGNIDVMPAGLVTEDRLNVRRRGRPKWTQLLSDVEARTPRHQNRLEFERALEFLLQFFRIELQARVYPFTREPNDDGAVVTLKFDQEMDNDRRGKAESALFVFYMNKVGPRPYFGDFFRSDETYEDGDRSIHYFADRGGLPDSRRLGTGFVIDKGDSFEVKIKVTSGTKIPEKGWLAPAQDTSRRIELYRQEDAVEELTKLGSLLSQIQDPQTIRTLRGPWEDAGARLRDDDPEIEGKDGQHFVQELLCCHPFYALHGPPGTGKTTVVSEAVAALLRREPTARVLVSAQSNFALDNLGERIGSLVREPGRILRVTSEAGEDKVSPPMRTNLLSELTTRVAKEISDKCAKEIINLHRAGHHELAKLSREWAEKIEDSKPDLQERVRSGANVVLATCSGATKLHIDRTTGSSVFDWVIVEEAARAWPTELAIPLIRGFRWALVGDHKQLPAHRIRDIERFLEICEESGNLDEIRRHGLDRETYMKVYRLFGELFKKIEQPSDVGAYIDKNPPLGQMRKQYRMRKPIANVISDAFYKVPPLLTSAHTEVDLPFKRPGFLHDGKALIWIDTSESPYFDDERCWKNKGEAALVRNLLLQMEPLPRKGDAPFSKNPLAIISPYREQNSLIEQQIRDLTERGVGGANVAKRAAVQKLVQREVIHSVHSIQGREADVVIASLVRSGAGPGNSVFGKLGHVADPALINVLFSRARFLLIVIGNLMFFEDCATRYPKEAGFWGEICTAVRNNAKIISAEDL